MKPDNTAEEICQFKQVAWAYPSSTHAEKCKMGKTGCWVVEITTLHPKKAIAPRLVEGFPPTPEGKLTAFRSADDLPQPWSSIQEFPPGYVRLDDLRKEIEEFGAWLEKGGVVPEDGASLLPNGEEAWNGFSAALLFADRFGGRLAGFHAADNPSANPMNSDDGRDFALIGPEGRFLVDWKAKVFEGTQENFVLDRRDPRDAEKIRAVYGDESKWEETPVQVTPISVFHAVDVTGEVPEAFNASDRLKSDVVVAGMPWSGRYIRVAEVPGRDLGLALKLTSHRPLEGDVPAHMRGQVEPWYAHLPNTLPEGFLVVGGAPTGGLFASGKNPVADLPNEVVVTAGVKSASRQTHRGDVAVMGGIAYAMPDANDLHPKFIPLPCESVMEMRREEEERRAEALADELHPEPHAVTTDSSLQM